MVQIYDQWRASFGGTRSPLEQGLIDQAASAADERAECLRIRAALRADVVRTADRYWEEAQEDAIERFRRMLDTDPGTAVVGLRRFAAGCRWMIARWERLEQLLAADGTWYGMDRFEAIQLQGLSGVVLNLYESEPAYFTWLHCLAAQPNPKQRDTDLVLDRRVMPKSVQDRDLEVWPGDPEASRAYLAAIVARALPPLRARAELLRVKYEEPARAEAKEQALARLACEQKEQALLRAQQGHEQSYERACRTFLKVRVALVAEESRSGGTRGVDESVLIPKLINSNSCAANQSGWPDSNRRSPAPRKWPPDRSGSRKNACFIGFRRDYP
jgi:hypothetical protein